MLEIPDIFWGGPGKIESIPLGFVVVVVGLSVLLACLCCWLRICVALSMFCLFVCVVVDCLCCCWSACVVFALYTLLLICLCFVDLSMLLICLCFCWLVLLLVFLC